MRVQYFHSGGRIVCIKFDDVILVDIMYQREFERFMLLYEIGGMDAVVSEFSAAVGL